MGLQFVSLKPAVARYAFRFDCAYWQVFGGYASEPWEKGRDGYYGDGETFLFTLLPVPNKFPWTEKNSYFQYSNHECLAFGGGTQYVFSLYCLSSHCQRSIRAVDGQRLRRWQFDLLQHIRQSCPGEGRVLQHYPCRVLVLRGLRY